ncbi:hypothetical protein CISIN_1g031870mg [Citrus sinensis]|uniref:MD-2-related lipid-recognition domain-containing protein n=1 Tax=Citrus sinensis TaxID=2711 RepID=A0A067E1I9_CITSI|nr:hypothetical protein CISIN_1g031870mg [Citrus sinensis]
MNRQLLLLFTFYVLVSSIQAIDFTYCGQYDEENFPLKVQQIKIIPDPVVTGKPAIFNISAVTDRSVSGGKVMIEVRYFGIRVHSETHDICEEVSCPIEAGNFVLSHAETLPGYTPPGVYTLKMKMIGKNGYQLTCFSFKFKIGFGALVSES